MQTCRVYFVARIYAHCNLALLLIIFVQPNVVSLMLMQKYRFLVEVSDFLLITEPWGSYLSLARTA